LFRQVVIQPGTLDAAEGRQALVVIEEVLNRLAQPAIGFDHGFLLSGVTPALQVFHDR
jgi:hypothetical protein